MRWKSLSLLSILVLACSSDEFEFVIEDEGLKMDGVTMSTYIPIDSILIETIQMVNLDTNRSFHPTRRFWGVGQPNIEIIDMDQYLEGWFLLQNGSIAFVFLSNQSEAVYLETSVRAPKQVLLIDDLQLGDRPDALKNVSIMIGTDKPELLMEIMLDHWE